MRRYKDGRVLVKPSKKNVHRFLTTIRKLIKDNAQATAGNLIVQLNPKIRGWANYHRPVSSKHPFVEVDDASFRAGWQWAKRRHAKKPRRWMKEKYFHSVGQRNWGFCGEGDEQDGTTRKVQLFYAHTLPLERHTKIKGDATPYDPQWEQYFEQRLGVKMVHNLKGKRQLISLWKEQSALCPVCHQRITKLTGWNNQHLVRRVDGGADRRENQVLLHPNCHRPVHSQGLSGVKPRPAKGREIGLSCLKRKFHGQFLGGWAAVTLLRLPGGNGGNAMSLTRPLRRADSYGTILVNLETRRPLDLLDVKRDYLMVS